MKACVTFANQISGFDLVTSSGIPYRAADYGSMGQAICQLAGEPAQVPANCLGTGAYWQYFHRTAGGWVQSSVGASGWVLHDGDMDGWQYASGAGQVPPSITFAQVCGVPPAAATIATPRVAVNPVATARPVAPAGTSPSETAATPASTAAIATARVQTTAIAQLPNSGGRPAAAVSPRPPWASLAVLVLVVALLAGLGARLLIRGRS